MQEKELYNVYLKGFESAVLQIFLECLHVVLLLENGF